MAMKTAEISNSDAIIDSRDVIARIEELESERQTLADSVDEAKTELQDNPAGEEIALQSVIEERKAELATWDEDNGAELKALKALADEGESLADWTYGVALVRESYFEDYARELAEDTGAIKRGMAWPYDCIDWERAAEQLKMDYTSVDFDGVTYYGR